MDLEIGATVGDYQVLGILGTGAMGKVYKVRNVLSDRIEALKILLPDLAAQAELADRFVCEIKVQAGLEHPNIAQLRTALRVENRLLMVMELVDGETLAQKLKGGPLRVNQAVDYIGQVLSALEYAHGRGVIHRDIRPANMMLTKAGVVKLMDFGITRAPSDQWLPVNGTTMSSLYYMSPEQIQSPAAADARSDVYSAGVSLYEMVTGKRPFDGSSPAAIKSAHFEATPAPPISLDPRLPQPLSDAILMSMARDPGARFQTAAAFRNALSSAVSPLRAEAVPVAPAATYRLIEPTKPEAPRSKRALWMAAGGVATAAAAIAVIQLAPWRGTGAVSRPEVRVFQQPGGNESALSSASGRRDPLSGELLPEPARPLQPSAAQPPPEVPETKQPPAQRAMAQQLPNPVLPRTRRNVGVSSQVTAVPPQQAPPPQPPGQAAQTPPPAPQGPQQPTSLAAKRQELQTARDKVVNLAARAATIQASLDTLQRSQAASGLGLRADMAEAAHLMNSNLQGAMDAIRANDPTAAETFIARAERQVERLEKFLNH
jgi:serine/threonine-protein kinase